MCREPARVNCEHCSRQGKESAIMTLVWPVLLISLISCGVQAAPEAFHRRQGDSAIVIPAPALNELEELNLPDHLEDPKHREDMAELLTLLQMYKNEMQRQGGAEEDPNGLDTALEGFPNMPLPASLQAKLFRNQDGVNKEEIKRGSYQPSLCYFKICNMGRKRNLS